jgi:YD repeat-containing protein
MDKDRNVINDPNSGVAITEYKYDEVGRRVETLVFDKDGNAVERKS